jgi:hypothetical protein
MKYLIIIAVATLIAGCGLSSVEVKPKNDERWITTNTMYGEVITDKTTGCSWYTTSSDSKPPFYALENSCVGEKQ